MQRSRKRERKVHESNNIMCQNMRNILWHEYSHYLVQFKIEEAFWMTGEISFRKTKGKTAKKEKLHDKETSMTEKNHWHWTNNFVNYWRHNCSNRMHNVILFLWIWPWIISIFKFENQQPPAQVFFLTITVAHVTPYLNKKDAWKGIIFLPV